MFDLSGLDDWLTTDSQLEDRFENHEKHLQRAGVELLTEREPVADCSEVRPVYIESGAKFSIPAGFTEAQFIESCLEISEEQFEDENGDNWPLLTQADLDCTTDYLINEWGN